MQFYIKSPNQTLFTILLLLFIEHANCRQKWLNIMTHNLIFPKVWMQLPAPFVINDLKNMQIKFIFSQTNPVHKGRGDCLQDHKILRQGISCSYLNPFCPSASLCCGWSTMQLYGRLVSTTDVTLLAMGCSGPGVGFRKKGTAIYPVYRLTDFLWGYNTSITCSTQANTLVCIFCHYNVTCYRG